MTGVGNAESGEPTPGKAPAHTDRNKQYEHDVNSGVLQFPLSLGSQPADPGLPTRSNSDD
jgi:hypothetical protein